MRLKLAALCALLAAPLAAQTYYTAATRPACTNNQPREIFIRDATAQSDCTTTGGGAFEAHCCCQDGSWAACATFGVGASGDNISVNSSAAADANFLDGDIDFTLVGASTPDDITATVNCSGCIDATDLGADSVAASEIAADAVDEPELKAVNSPTDEYVLTYETTTGDFEWQVDQGSSGNRLYTFENPPASAGTYDDEFNDGNITGWSIASSGTTNPATTGTIDYSASLTTPIVDATTVLGWVMFQSDNSTAQQFYIYKSYSAATDETWLARMGGGSRDVSANTETDQKFQLINSGDTNEFIEAGINHNGTSVFAFCNVQNNGANTLTNVAAAVDKVPIEPWTFVIWKKTNTYYCGWQAGNNGPFTLVAVMTKTGVTTLDQIRINATTANETPSNVTGFDYIRYKASLDYSLVNP